MVNVDKQRQEAQYIFPYHYLPHFDKSGIPRIARALGWGFEYLTYTKIIQEEIAALSPAPECILDVGCGDGWLLNSLGASIEKHGVDLSARAIAFAKAFATESIFEVRDIHEMNTEYDALTCIEVLEHVPDETLADFVGNIIRLVKEGGYLIVSVPTTAVKLNKKHYRHYDEALLTAHIESSQELKLVKERRVYRVSAVLNVANRLLHNRLWTINYTPLLRAFWLWHSRSNVDAGKNDGAHLIRVYRKC